jgi:hypothetical protein
MRSKSAFVTAFALVAFTGCGDDDGSDSELVVPAAKKNPAGLG